MTYKCIYLLVIDYILLVNIISFSKYNYITFKEILSFDYIAKIKIKGRGNQSIINPKITNYNAQKFPDEISIEKNNRIINIGGGIYNINSEEDENIVIMKWNTYPISTKGMFQNCINITEIDLTQFDLTLIKNMQNMFLHCYSLTSIKFGNYHTFSLEYISRIFNDCYKLISIDLSMFDTSNVGNMDNMFLNCRSLESLNLTNFKTDKATSFNRMFMGCENLKKLDLSNFNTKSAKKMSYMFCNCSKLSSLILSSFDTSNTVNMSFLFSGCSSLISLDLSNFNTSKVENMRNMFESMYSLKSLNISNFDTKNVKEMRSMFKSCSSLTYLDLSYFDTSKIEYISEMFINCSNLEFLNVSNWGNGKIMSMRSIFRDCHSLKEIDLSNFNILHVKAINSMFYNCYSLTSIDLSSFDTSYTTSMGHMFYGCNSLISLNITHFNASILEYVDNMFNGCYSLISLDLSNFQSSNIKNFQNMFKNCTNLSYINMQNYIEYNNDSSIYNDLFNNIKNNLIICVQKDNTPIISNLTKEIGCATIYCGEDFFRIKKEFDIEKNICKLDCSEDYPFEVVSAQECVKNCQIDSILKKECILNFEESTKTEDIILKNSEISFISEEYNTSNLDNGNEEIIKNGKMIITLTTIETQKYNYDNNINMTAIDIGGCENLLREENDIPAEENLYMRKIDIYEEQIKIPKIEFEIYYKENNTKLKKLDLTICENSDIHLAYPVDISENLDLYNPKSDYYNNICHPTTSDAGTDIILNDRQTEFVEGNKTICQEGCSLEKYNSIHKISKCTCKGKEFKSNINSISDIKIDKEKLIDNFIHINNIANIQLFKCYKLLFSKEGIIKNIAFYLIIPIILFHFVSIFFFIFIKKGKFIKK